MKILLVDHNVLFREGLRHILQQSPDFVAEILEAGSFPDGLKIAGHNPDLDLVLLELDSPGSSGAAPIRLFYQLYPHIPILVVSGMEVQHGKEMALAYGASGFVSKRSTVPMFLNALQQVLSGSIQQFVAEESTCGCPMLANECGLTARQMEILKYMAEGLSNREIGEKIDLAENTVKAHAAAVYRILCVKNRIEAVYIFMRRGLTGMACA